MEITKQPVLQVVRSPGSQGINCSLAWGDFVSIYDMQKLHELFSLENKVVLLTGAAGSIGRVMAEGFAAVGATMALCDIRMDDIKNIADRIGKNAGCYHLDLLEMDSIKKCVDAVIADFGRIDVLVNCAGINKREGFLDVDESTYDRIMNVNLKGMFFLTQEVVKHMI